MLLSKVIGCLKPNEILRDRHTDNTLCGLWRYQDIGVKMKPNIHTDTDRQTDRHTHTHLIGKKEYTVGQNTRTYCGAQRPMLSALPHQDRAICPMCILLFELQQIFGCIKQHECSKLFRHINKSLFYLHIKSHLVIYTISRHLHLFVHFDKLRKLHLILIFSS